MQHPTMPPPHMRQHPPRPFVPTQFRPMRLVGLLVLVGLLLGGGFLLVLYLHGRQQTMQAIEMVSNPPWLHQTDIYPPAEEKPAAVAPAAHDPYAAKFAELMAKLAGLEASVNDLKQRKPSTTT